MTTKDFVIIVAANLLMFFVGIIGIYDLIQIKGKEVTQ